MSNNKIDVRIFGEVYTVAGGDSADYILKIAGDVDRKMREIGQAFGISSKPDIAVLAALNIADDLCKLKDGTQSETDENRRLKSELEDFQHLWEEAQNSFAQLKAEAQKTSEQLAQEQVRLQDMAEENRSLSEKLSASGEENEQLFRKMKELKTKLEDTESLGRDKSDEMKELMEKTKELETNFFDIQMENIQLKSELEKFRKNVIEW